jgi:deoxycytidine triphosphate deaminase
MIMLSDRNIARELGKGININPFNKENVQGASIYLTASKLAWSSKKGDYLYKNDIIEIPSNDTAFIITNEFVKLDNNYVATCHARLSLTMKGLSYYATPIKPGYGGKLIIALQNNTDKPIEISVNEKIVAVMFNNLTSKASFTKDGKPSPEVYLIRNSKINVNDEQHKIYNDPDNATDSDNNKRYKEFKDKMNKKPERSTLLAYGFSILFIIGAILVFLFNSKDALYLLVPILGSAAIAFSFRLQGK